MGWTDKPLYEPAPPVEKNPWYRLTPRTQAERQRIRQARYQVTAKGRAARARYNASAKGRAADARNNPRRLFIGRRFAGYADTSAQAETINAHIRSRLHEFVSGQQSRAETKSVSTGTVSPEAES